jgi:hypothetical protein
MQAPHVYIVHHNGYDIECYGELQEDSNFSVVCENEEDDEIWCEGNPNSEEYTFSSWEEVVEVLSRYFDDIVEISAV